MLIWTENINNRLTINYINEDGKPETYTETIPEEFFYDWKFTKSKTEFVNWDGRFVTKNTNIKKFSPQRLQDYLIRELDEDIRNKIFANNTPRKFFCDIETEITKKIDPKNPAGKILTISLVTPENKVYVLGLKSLSKEEIQEIEIKINKHIEGSGFTFQMEYNQFEDEYEMLYTFVNKILPKCSMITGWNFVWFDWTYILNRCRLLGISLDKAFDTYNCLNDEELPKNIMVIDYLDVFKTYDTSLKVKRNNKLDNIAKLVLGFNKIHFTGSLQKLYEQDFLTYVFYNAIDSVLVRLIDEKTACFQVKQSLAYLYKTSIYKTERKVVCGEHLLQDGFLQMKNRVFAPRTDKPQSRPISGGYVKIPTPGYYDYLCVLDFSSLYPSIIRQFEISPETYIGQLSDELLKKYDEDIIIKTKQGAVFKKEHGVLPRLLDDIYKRRKEIQSESLTIEQEIKKVQKQISKLED